MIKNEEHSKKEEGLHKSSDFSNPSLLQIETINIGHKSLLIIIEP